MKRLLLDYESRSELDLSEVGLDRYATNPSTQVILGAYCYDDGPVSLWEPHLSTIPHDLEDGLLDDKVEKWAWNSAFERIISKWILDIEIPIRSFKDVMIQARYVSLPGSLDDCGKALNMPPELLKTEAGKLKNMFCLPAKPGGQETLFGISEPLFKDWESNAIEWREFCSYCIQDCVAERAILNRLSKFPLMEKEWELYFLDQEINERGIAVDQPLVDGGSYIALTSKTHELDKLQTITELDNPNSNDQILNWARERGYPFHSIGKPFVNRALAGEGNITPECKEALIIRQKTAKTSATKLINIHNQVGSDGRLRHQYNFYGAGRTGRWTSGSGE